MPKVTLNRYLLYLGRWQLSSPVLYPVLLYADYWLNFGTNINFLVATILANFIGGLIFFWVDRFIFRQKYQMPLWEIRGGVCKKCGEMYDRLFRLVKAPNYDRLDDQDPMFLCDECSKKKTKELRTRGVAV